MHRNFDVRMNFMRSLNAGATAWTLSCTATGFSLSEANVPRPKCGQRGFVKTAQDTFFLARIGVDVADRKNAGLGCAEIFGIDNQLLAFHGQTPLGDGAQFGRQTQAGLQNIRL